MIQKLKNNKIAVIVSLLVLAIVTLAILFFSTKFTGNNPQDKIIATVNNQDIFQYEVEDKIAEFFQGNDEKVDVSKLPKEVLETLVKDIYLQKELYKKAKKISKDKAIVRKIENYSQNLINKAYIESLVAEQITDKKIKNKYIELSSDLSGKEEMHIKHILVDTKQQADDIYGQIKSKKEILFEDLAKKYSIDKANSSSGGDLGYLIVDNLDDNFFQALKDLESGMISRPIKTDFGWHIVKIFDIRDVKLPNFEAVKMTIKNQLKQDEAERIFEGITKNVKIIIKSK